MATLISSRNTSLLPNKSSLKCLCQSIAMLDAILEPEWDLRYYSFNSKWAIDEMMASMRDGSGSTFHIVFSSKGAIILGNAHDSLMADALKEQMRPWPGILENVPVDFENALNEPAFSPREITFCIWSKVSDTSWHLGDISFPVGDDPDGSGELLHILDGNPQTYRKWSREYHESEVPLDAIKHIYERKPLNNQIVAALNPDLIVDDLLEDIAEIGYPRSSEG